MSFRVYIADANNSNQIELDRAEFPNPWPHANRERRVELHTTRPSATTPGRRVVSDMGTHVSYTDLELVCRHIDADKFALLQAKFDAWPPAQVLVSLQDGQGEKKYLCSWARDGLQAERTTFDGDRRRGRLRFHVHSEV